MRLGAMMATSGRLMTGVEAMPPSAPSGVEALIAFLHTEFPASQPLPSGYPLTKFEFVLAQGDLVQLMFQREIPDPHAAGKMIKVWWYDTYRVQDGKIVEHWDAIQDVPETSANPNTMFDGPTSSPSKSSEVLERNTANALTFLQLAFNEGKAAEAADQLVEAVDRVADRPGAAVHRGVHFGDDRAELIQPAAVEQQ